MSAPAVRRVAMIAMHTSPVAQPGRGDAGGLNVTVRETAERLAALGVEVDLVTRGEEDGVTELAPGLALRTIAAGHGLPKERLVEAADAFGEGVARLARERRYDVLHAHYWLSGIAALPVSLELGVPLVQSFHTLAVMKNAALPPGSAPEPERRLRSEAYLAAQADAIVVGSRAEVAALLPDPDLPDPPPGPDDAPTGPVFRTDPAKVWMVPPGVDEGLFAPGERRSREARVKAGVAPGSPLLVVAGRLDPLKGQEFAVEVLAELGRRRGDHPVLVVAGGPPPGVGMDYVRRVVERASELGVTRATRMIGPVERLELADLLAAADLVLVPSRSETFGLVALEAAASGTPVIASRTTGLIDSVADGVSGLLLPGYDAAEWAREADALLTDAGRRASLGASAREHASRFGWATAAASLLGIYAALTARS